VRLVEHITPDDITEFHVELPDNLSDDFVAAGQRPSASQRADRVGVGQRNTGHPAGER
jgi:hypothetical protein